MPEPLADGADFLLRIKGESMVNAGILDGDTVVVQRRPDARNGEIVVALVGDDETADEATVKRFFREDGRIRLQPENDDLEPIYAQHVEILGKVVGCSADCDRGRPAQPHVRPGSSRSCAGSASSAWCAASSSCARPAPCCPECGFRLRDEKARKAGLQLDAGRVTAGRLEPVRESPDTVGQDAGEIPDGESRWKVAQKGTARSRTTLETPR